MWCQLFTPLGGNEGNPSSAKRELSIGVPDDPRVNHARPWGREALKVKV